MWIFIQHRLFWLLIIVSGFSGLTKQQGSKCELFRSVADQQNCVINAHFQFLKMSGLSPVITLLQLYISDVETVFGGFHVSRVRTPHKFISLRRTFAFATPEM